MRKLVGVELALVALFLSVSCSVLQPLLTVVGGGDFHNLLDEAKNSEILGDYTQAREYYQKALRHPEEFKAREIATISNSLGTLYEIMGDYDQAKSYFEDALGIFQTLREKNGDAAALSNLGNIYGILGDYPQALDYHQQALTIFRNLKDKANEATVLTNLGVVQGSLNNHQQALQSHQDALKIFKTLGDEKGKAIAYLQMGATLEKLGDYSKAKTAFENSAKISKTLDPEIFWRTQSGLSAVAARIEEEPAEAIRYYEQAIHHLEQLRAGLAKRQYRLRQYGLSFMQYKLSVYDELITFLLQQHPKYPTHGYAQQAFEVFEKKQGRINLKGLATSEAWRLAGLFDMRESELEAELKHTSQPLSDIHQRQSELKQQRELKQQSDLIVEKSRPRPPRPNFLSPLLPPDDETETTIASLTKLRETEAKLTEELRKTEVKLAPLRAPIKAGLQEVRLQRDKYYYALKHPQPVTLATLQNKVLQPTERLLVYAVMEDKTLLWVIGNKQFETFTLPISEKDWQALPLLKHLSTWQKNPPLIESLKLLANNPYAGFKLSQDIADDLKILNQESYDFYSKLFPPAIQALLAQVKTLYIVPTGPLYGIPFESLVVTPPTTDDALPHYLLADYEIAYLSSASLLKILRDTDYTPPPQSLLAVAHPKFPQTDCKVRENTMIASRTRAYQKQIGQECFPELPETETEARTVAKFLQAPDSSILLRDQASRANILELNQQQQLKDYQYLLFATHAILPAQTDEIRQPALVLSHTQTAEENGYLTVADVYGLQLNARLVTLSACNTGQGEHITGEGIRGLAQAFMYAGSTALAATLWEVHSESLRQLNETLFKQLRQGRPLTTALQEAKRALWQHSQYRHPYFWAPLVVFGEGSR